MSGDLAVLAIASSLAIAGAALVAAAIALLTTGQWKLALGVLLDLLLAAGLVRLSADPDWEVIAVAAAVVVLRRLLGMGLRIGRHNLSGGGGPAGSRQRGPDMLASPAFGELLRPTWRN